MEPNNDQNGTKERIRRIAADLFARNGYHATGMSELGDAVQLGRGTLYYYINNKEAVLYEICTGAIEQLIADAQQIVASNRPPVDTVQALARGLMRNIAAHRAEWTVFFREFSVLTGDHRTKVLRARETYEEIWRRVIDEGASTGDFVPVDSVVVKGLLGMFNYSYLWFDPDGKLTPDDVADRFSNAVLNGMVPRSL